MCAHTRLQKKWSHTYISKWHETYHVGYGITYKARSFTHNQKISLKYQHVLLWYHIQKTTCLADTHTADRHTVEEAAATR